MRTKTIMLTTLLGISVAFCLAWTAGGTFSTGAGGASNTTFGDQTAKDTNSRFLNGNMRGMKYTNASAGNLVSITARIQCLYGPTYKCRAVCYDGSGNLVDISAEKTISTADSHWETFTMNGAAVAAADYYLMLWGDGGTGYVALNYDSGVQGYYAACVYSSSGNPTDPVTLSTINDLYALYATVSH